MSIARSAALKATGLNPGVGVLGIAGAGVAGAALSSGNEKEKGWVVPEGFVAVRMRFDKPRRNKRGESITYGPGIRPHMLFMRSNKLVSVQDRLDSLGEIPINRNGLTLVEGQLIWGVAPEGENPANSIVNCKAGEIGSLVVAKCANAFRMVMSTVPPDKFQPLASMEINDWDIDSTEVDRHLREGQELVSKICRRMGSLCAGEISQWGAEIRGLTIKSDAPHPFTSIPTNVDPSAMAALVASQVRPELNTV